MNTFDDREKAFEKKYAMDAELQFKLEARRNKALGLWAAEIMGMGATEAQEYAKSVIISDMQEAGDDDVFRKVWADLSAKNAEVSEAALRSKMDTLTAEVKTSMIDEDA